MTKTELMVILGDIPPATKLEVCVVRDLASLSVWWTVELEADVQAWPSQCHVGGRTRYKYLCRCRSKAQATKVAERIIAWLREYRETLAQEVGA